MAKTEPAQKIFYREVNEFRTVNTFDSPVTMKDDELDIILNFMPIGKSLFTVPGASNSLVQIGSTEAAWQATHTYATNAIVRPTAGVANGFIYMVTAGGGGNSGGGEPTWPLVNGNTVVDGAITWTAYDLTVKRTFIVNISGTLYHLLACNGGMMYRFDGSNQFRLSLPNVFTNPRFDQWQNSAAVIIDSGAGYYEYTAISAGMSAAGTAIATTNTKVKFTNNILYFIAATQYSISATDNFWDLTGFNCTNLYYNQCYLYITSGGAAAIAAGTQGTTLNGVVMPAIDTAKSLVGVLTIHPTGTGNFTGGTTALNDVTVIPNAVFSDQALLNKIDSSNKGTCICVWQGRVWIGNNRTVSYSAPGYYKDFTVQSGAGAVVDNYPDLRNSISNFAATQNYLYVIGDHATHIIYGLQLLSGANTAFQLIDAMPMVGSPYPDSVQVVGNVVYMMADYGIFIVNAGSFKLVSSYLDGAFPSIDTSFLPVSFMAKIYNKLVFCVLVKIASLIDGNNQKWLMCHYEGRWFFILMGQTSSWLNLTYCGQKLTSVDTQCFGAAGNNLYQFFTGVGTMWHKARTRAYTFGTSLLDKQVLKVGATIVATTGLSETVQATITAIGSGSPDANITAGTVPPINFNSAPFTWTTSGGGVFTWTYSSGTFVWTLSYSEIENFQSCDGRGKRIQLDWDEISTNQYQITGLGIEGQYGPSY